MENEGFPTFRVTAALGKYIQVKLSSGKLVAAGATDENFIGATCEQTFSADEPVAIKTPYHPGVQKAIAAGAISVGAEVFAAANGKLDDSGTVKRGIAVTAAGADGDSFGYIAQNALAEA